MQENEVDGTMADQPDSPVMQETRILSMPEGSERFLPPAPGDVGPNDYIVLHYGPFMEVVREMAGGMHSMQLFAHKLEAAVAAEAADQFRGAIESAKGAGGAVGELFSIEGLHDACEAARKVGYHDGFEDGKRAAVGAGTSLGSIPLTPDDLPDPDDKVSLTEAGEELAADIGAGIGGGPGPFRDDLPIADGPDDGDSGEEKSSEPTGRRRKAKVVGSDADKPAE